VTPDLHDLKASVSPCLHDLQTYATSRPARPPDLHDLQTYTASFTSTIKREGRRSPGTAVAGRIAGISRMMGKS
jgi:hypothetical protein